jgi:hypothetical protein
MADISQASPSTGTNGTGVHGAQLDALQGDRLREAVRRGAPSLVVLDVRSPGEFLTAHIAGSYNVPLDQLPGVAQPLQPDRRPGLPDRYSGSAG